jgi:hypothetical protein
MKAPHLIVGGSVTVAGPKKPEMYQCACLTHFAVGLKTVQFPL